MAQGIPYYALDSYFGTGVSLQVNKDLRSGSGLNEFTKPFVEDFNRRSLPIRNAVKSYRVLRKEFVDGLKIVDTITDAGFVSTTIDRKYAGKFNPEQIAMAGWVGAKKPKTVTATVLIPQGTKVISHGRAGESEILMGPGTTMRVVKTNPLTILFKINISIIY